ncbi:asialoglycoprotein receptor 1-like isoform X2 [Cheilinus undulatus]|uniref:asialoglycoprotein receptor 1-like isoform X2 n=1 Tax=Cheilinus undulatus TaxID=241271 RepID=UPI001BD25C5D|nr:asialoglycoprotein receptor 1-like isoform X2 [Cheilinus undulatus]
MAEEELKYASVVFKKKKNSPPEAKEEEEEETVYNEVKVQKQTNEPTADTNKLLLEEKTNSSCSCNKLVCCLAFLCVIVLLGIIAVTVYLVKLRSENENLRREHTNLMVRFVNLTQAYGDLENTSSSQAAEIQNLAAQNQDLQTQKENLTEQIQKFKTEQYELNVTRAQWSIHAYCPKAILGRSCKPCQEGWVEFQSSCCAVNNVRRSKQKTWEEAREDCRGEISDLTVIQDLEDMDKIQNNWGSVGYWIGLRVQDGAWKWVDGTTLTSNVWNPSEARQGHCAIFKKAPTRELKAVKCSERYRWICQKKAVTI